MAGIKFGPADFGFVPGRVDVLTLSGAHATLISGPTIGADGRVSFCARAGTYQIVLGWPNASYTVTHTVTLRDPVISPDTPPDTPPSGGVTSEQVNELVSAAIANLMPGIDVQVTSTVAAVVDARVSAAIAALPADVDITAPQVLNIVSAAVSELWQPASTMSVSNVADFPAIDPSGPVYIDESFAVRFNDTAYWVSGYNGNNYGYVPYIFPFDLAADAFGSPIPIPPPPGAPAQPPSVTVDTTGAQTTYQAATGDWAPGSAVAFLGTITTQRNIDADMQFTGDWSSIQNLILVRDDATAVGDLESTSVASWCVLLDTGFASPGLVSPGTYRVYAAAVDGVSVGASVGDLAFDGVEATNDAAHAGWGFEGGVAAGIGRRIYFGLGDSNLYTPVTYNGPLALTPTDDGPTTDPVTGQARRRIATVTIDGKSRADVKVTFARDVDMTSLPSFGLVSFTNAAGNQEVWQTLYNSFYGEGYDLIEEWSMPPGTYDLWIEHDDPTATIITDTTVGGDWFRLSVMKYSDEWSDSYGVKLMSYDVDDHQFRPCADKPNSFDYGFSAVADGKLYTFFGPFQNQDVDPALHIEVYDPDEDAWTVIGTPADNSAAYLAARPNAMNAGLDLDMAWQVGRWIYCPDLGIKWHMDTHVFVDIQDPVNGWDWDGLTAYEDGVFHWFVSEFYRVLDPATDTWSDGSRSLALGRWYGDAIKGPHGWRFFGGDTFVAGWEPVFDHVLTREDLLADSSSPEDGYVVTWDATNQRLRLAPSSGGSGGGGLTLQDVDAEINSSLQGYPTQADLTDQYNDVYSRLSQSDSGINARIDGLSGSLGSLPDFQNLSSGRLVVDRITQAGTTYQIPYRPEAPSVLYTDLRAPADIRNRTMAGFTVSPAGGGNIPVAMGYGIKPGTTDLGYLTDLFITNNWGFGKSLDLGIPGRIHPSVALVGRFTGDQISGMYFPRAQVLLACGEDESGAALDSVYWIDTTVMTYDNGVYGGAPAVFPLPNAPHKRTQHATIALNGWDTGLGYDTAHTVLLVGGLVDDGNGNLVPSLTTDIFDPFDSSWKAGPDYPMPPNCYTAPYACSATHDGRYGMLVCCYSSTQRGWVFGALPFEIDHVNKTIVWGTWSHGLPEWQSGYQHVSGAVACCSGQDGIFAVAAGTGWSVPYFCTIGHGLDGQLEATMRKMPFDWWAGSGRQFGVQLQFGNPGQSITLCGGLNLWGTQDTGTTQPNVARLTPAILLAGQQPNFVDQESVFLDKSADLKLKADSPSQASIDFGNTVLTTTAFHLSTTATSKRFSERSNDIYIDDPTNWQVVNFGNESGWAVSGWIQCVGAAAGDTIVWSCQDALGSRQVILPVGGGGVVVLPTYFLQSRAVSDNDNGWTPITSRVQLMRNNQFSNWTVTGHIEAVKLSTLI